MAKRELVLDTETTGFMTAAGDEIIEIAMVEVLDGIVSGNYFHEYYLPKKMIDISAANVHGLFLYDLLDKPRLDSTQAQKISDYINHDDLIIHNAGFDMGFLDSHFKRFGMDIFTIAGEVVDTLAIARFKFPKLRNSLDALCDRFKISRNDRSYHGALVDCELLANVYIELKKEQLDLDLNIKKNAIIKNREYIKFESVK